MVRSKSQTNVEPDEEEFDREKIKFKFSLDSSSDDEETADDSNHGESSRKRHPNHNVTDDQDDEDDDDDNDDDASQDDQDTSATKKEVFVPEENPLSRIKNKLRRREMYEKYLAEKRKQKQEERAKKRKMYEQLGEDAPPKPIPRTIENTREPDETMVPDDDEEIAQDEALDEFASYFNKEKEPKLLITTSDNYHELTIKFCKQFCQTIPNCEFRTRRRMSLKSMCVSASEKGYTDILVVNEDRRKPNGLLAIHLPNGPTANFKLTSIKYMKEIKKRVPTSDHRPEVILNNFNTRLGHSIGRMLASLYHYDPEFKGRRVITFHNQRDYIFFRHHRYQFKDGKRVALREIGPRFTLKLRWLQRGTFDSKCGEYIWLLKRHEMETSRRRFFL